MKFTCNKNIDDTTKQKYIEHVQAKSPKDDIDYIDVKFVENDEVEITYKFADVHFERIRRITGYLVGDMRHWNNGKRAEEHARVKHGLDCSCTL